MWCPANMLSQVAPDFSFLARREDAYVRALHKDEQRRQGRKRLANYETYLWDSALVMAGGLRAERLFDARVLQVVIRYTKHGFKVFGGQHFAWCAKGVHTAFIQ